MIGFEIRDHKYIPAKIMLHGQTIATRGPPRNSVLEETNNMCQNRHAGCTEWVKQKEIRDSSMLTSAYESLKNKRLKDLCRPVINQDSKRGKRVKGNYGVRMSAKRASLPTQPTSRQCGDDVVRSKRLFYSVKVRSK
jgi:hypothetical protein